MTMNKQDVMGDAPKGHWVQLPRTLSTQSQEHKTHPLPRETSLKTWVSGAVTVEHREFRTNGDTTVFGVVRCVRCWLWRGSEAPGVCGGKQKELCVS